MSDLAKPGAEYGIHRVKLPVFSHVPKMGLQTHRRPNVIADSETMGATSQ